ncbi:hypothetical protein [Legionella birminghamensis]|nr:hypothetical protein [Legionella birminghamensis]
MTQSDHELFRQIENALSPDKLTCTNRVDLIFSSLFELDNKLRAQSSLSEDEKANWQTSIESLKKQLAATAKTNDKDIKWVRKLFMQVLKNPELFGLSKSMNTLLNPLFDPDAKTLDSDKVLFEQKKWMLANVFGVQDLTTETTNAQVFIDALRKGNYTIALQFSHWVVNKYMDIKLNPKQIALGADNILPLIAYELALTDIRREDMAAIMHLHDHSQGSSNQYTATLFFSGLTILQNHQSALKRQHPHENELQILARMQNDYQAFLKSDNPVKHIVKSGALFDEEDEAELNEYYTQEKIASFASTNRERLTHNLILLNTENASPADILGLLELKQKVIQYVNYLQANTPANPQETFNNRVIAANNMLQILQKGGSIKKDIIPGIKVQAAIIAKNQPGLQELGLLGWLKSFFDRFKPRVIKETSSTLNAISDIVKSRENQDLKKPDDGMNTEPPSCFRIG